MVLELFKLQGQIGVDGGPQAIQTLSQIDSAGKQTASGLNSVAQTAAGVAVGMGAYNLVMQGVGTITGLLQEGFMGLNQQLESSRVGFTTMMGSAGAANAMLKDLQDFAATTPFEFPQLLESAQRLQAMGFAAKEVIPMMTAIGDAVAGLGRGPETIERVTLALGRLWPSINRAKTVNPTEVKWQCNGRRDAA